MTRPEAMRVLLDAHPGALYYPRRNGYPAAHLICGATVQAFHEAKNYSKVLEAVNTIVGGPITPEGEIST